MPLTGLAIGCLGGGAMAQALLTGLIKSGIQPQNLYVSDTCRERLEFLHRELGVHTREDNRALVKETDVVMLAVKPQAVQEVLQETGVLFQPQQTLISIAAGITTQFIESFLAQPV
ncbi:MAG: pyrroline-5-carboxylate reductase family protein, partial [Desulfofundulus sp.]